MNRSRAFALVIVGVAMVSYSGPLVKGMLLLGASPVSVAFLRMLLSGALLTPFCLGEIKTVLRAGPKMLALTALAAAFLALHYGTWMTSLGATSTFASVALVCTQPLFVAAFSGLLLHEPIEKRARPGALVAVCGALLIGAAGLTGGASGTLGGDALALLGAAAMAGHWLCGRRARRELPAAGYTAVIYLLTAAMLGALLPVTGGLRMPSDALLHLAGLVLGSTLLGHLLFTLALGHVSADVVSFALLGEPVGAMLFALVFLGETPTPLLLAGGAVVLLGLFLYLRGAMAHHAPQSGGVHDPA